MLGSLNARARGLLDWLAVELPAVQQMREPLTEAGALQLVKSGKYTDEDIQRIFRAIDNKDATSQKNALSAFYSFAAHDFILKDRKAEVRKYYTYNEVCAMCDKFNGGIYDMAKDFVCVEVNGERVWQKKTDAINRTA